MEWTDKGLILTTRSHSETSAILELFTPHHGRHLGLIRGGRSRRMLPILQIGNLLQAQWRARLSEHLGHYSVELITPYAAPLINEPLALAVLSSLTAFARLLPERDPHKGLYEALILILTNIDNRDLWPGLMIRWELELLKELGFGLALSQCVATSTHSDLIYVSPKSGSAVSAKAGAPYKEKLMPLPPFLRDQTFLKSESPAEITPRHILDGFALTGFFLERHVLIPRQLKMPEARSRLLSYLCQKNSPENSVEQLSTAGAR